MERNAKFVVRLDGSARGRLQEMVDRGRGSKTIRNRALILLKADEGEGRAGWTDAKIAEAFGVGVRTVERTRRLLVVEGFEGVLVRKPSPNRQYRKLDGAQEAALVQLACSKPPAGRVRGTLRLLADRLVELEVVTAIGREAVRTTLQKTISSRGSASTGYYPRRATPSSSVRWKTSSTCTRAPTARRLIGRLEVHYTPKHGSGLNMAETELIALSTQCLDRRLGEKSELQSEVAAWGRHRNTVKCRVDGQFTTKDARVKLKRLYPTIQTG